MTKIQPKKERITCKEYCIYWNEIDKDCEMFGENHPRPRRCNIWLNKNPDYVKKTEDNYEEGK